LKEKEDEIQYLREQMGKVHLQLRILAQKMEDLEKISDYANTQGKEIADMLGVTERPTKKELEEMKKKILG